LPARVFAFVTLIGPLCCLLCNFEGVFALLANADYAFTQDSECLKKMLEHIFGFLTDN
jgi:hypothetical protein